MENKVPKKIDVGVRKIHEIVKHYNLGLVGGIIDRESGAFFTLSCALGGAEALGILATANYVLLKNGGGEQAFEVTPPKEGKP